MILPLRIKLLFGRWKNSPWECEIDVDAKTSLAELHNLIQQAVHFDNDHLFEFFIARTDRSRDRIRYDEEDDELFTHTLDDIFPLPKNRNLYYMFDYGDSWYFQVSRTRRRPFLPKSDMDYPLLVSQTGKRPEQYPDPDWD